MDRLASMFASARAEGRTAFLPFMTAGLPDPATSVAMFEAMNAVDAFEVGIPYSDPLMDGPTIQEAGQRALAAGTNFAIGLDIASQVAKSTDKPILIMTYTNVVIQVGIQEFARSVHDAGASGVIVADLPLDEAPAIHEALTSIGVGLVLFAAPTTTDERIAAVAAASPVFIYGVAEMGTTGERTAASNRAAGLAERVRAVTDVPLVMGVGISTPDHARAIRPHADGVIVGSALVRRVLDADSAESAATALAGDTAAFGAALRDA